MKRTSFLIVVLFFIVASSVLFGSRSVERFANLPAGSYQATCQNCQLSNDGNWLTGCRCQNSAGEWVDSPNFYANTCVNETDVSIYNRNGKLACSYPSPPPQPAAPPPSLPPPPPVQPLGALPQIIPQPPMPPTPPAVVQPPPLVPPTPVQAAPAFTMFPASCVRPSGWCGHPGAQVRQVDCMGNGVAGDILCTDTQGQRGTMLRSDGCASVWPNAPITPCFSSTGPTAAAPASCTGPNANYSFVGNNGQITKGTTLNQCQGIKSSDGGHIFVMQSDGNAVIYNEGNNQATWASQTNNRGSPPYTFAYQTDNNLVTYNSSGPTWSSGTNGKASTSLNMQSDGNLVQYNLSGNQQVPIWSSQTYNK